MSIKFSGINETLFYLKNYEKELYNTLRTDLVDAAKPLAAVVGAAFPATPLSNWHTSGGRVGVKRLPPYNASAARTKIKPVTGGTSKKTAQGGVAILRLQQADGGAAIYDAVGKGNYESKGSTFITNLDSKTTKKSTRGKPRSRVMFTATRQNMPMVEASVTKIVRKVDEQTTKRILNIR